jgi:DNA-directed RNA polymerase
MPSIQKCSNDPINNLEWLKSDAPFQALAGYFELTNALNV